jgi:hypothetical protein
MPNGCDIPEPRLRELELPLQQIDDAVSEFARRIAGRVERNYHGFVSRSIVVLGHDRIRRTIQISPALLDLAKGWEADNYCYGFFAMAWKDTGSRRRFWHKTVAQFRSMPASKRKVMATLRLCWARLQRIGDDDLAFSELPE